MTFCFITRRREHNLEGWPRLSLSVNDAARSEGVPVSISSLPSDVDAAEMAAFVPFGPKAHRTTPASSWRTNSVHTMPRRQVSHLSWGILNCFQGFQRERRAPFDILVPWVFWASDWPHLAGSAGEASYL